MIILLYWIAAAVALTLAFMFGAEMTRAKFKAEIEELTAQRDAAGEVLAFVKEENLKIRALLGTPQEADAMLYGAITGNQTDRDSQFSEQAYSEMRMRELGYGDTE